MSLMSLSNGRRDNTFQLSFKLAAKVCIFAHIAKIFVSFLLYFHHFSYLCTRNKKQPLKTGVHWTLRGTDHSECLQQTDNQPSNWKGSTPSSSTRTRRKPPSRQRLSDDRKVFFVPILRELRLPPPMFRASLRARCTCSPSALRLIPVA